MRCCPIAHASEDDEAAGAAETVDEVIGCGPPAGGPVGVEVSEALGASKKKVGEDGALAAGAGAGFGASG